MHSNSIQNVYTIIRKPVQESVWRSWGRNIQHLYCMLARPMTDHMLAKKLFQGNLNRVRRYLSILQIYQVVEIYEGERKLLYHPEKFMWAFRTVIFPKAELFYRQYCRVLEKETHVFLSNEGRKQFIQTMQTITALLSQPDCLVLHLYRMRFYEKGRTRQYYLGVHKALVKAVQFCYGLLWTEELSQFWSDTFTLLLNIIQPVEIFD
jgi:hypothetical protein